MKKHTSRAEIESALRVKFVECLDSLAPEQTAETLMATFKALVTIAFDIVEGGQAPREVVAQKLSKIAKRRLPRLKRAEPAWVMPEAKA